MNANESAVHQGHRRRMKEKLRIHGARIFNTYELLEMLLYNVIPYRDTNPIAKELLARFGSLDGVLGATVEELAAVDGIGARTAEFVETVGEVTRFIGETDTRGIICDSYERVGDIAVAFFERNPDIYVAELLLDNSMRLIGIEKIPGEHFGSAAVKPKYFIDGALRHSASVVILAYKHPHGPLFPLASELVTTELVCRELAQVGIEVAEEYIVVGTRYIGAARELSLKLSYDNPDLMRYLASCGEPTVETVASRYGLAAESGVERVMLNRAMSANRDEPIDGEEIFDAMERLLSFVMRGSSEDDIRDSARMCCGALLLGRQTYICDAEQDGVAMSISMFFRLLGALASRRVTDRLRFGRSYGDEQIEEYFKALYIGHSAETVYMMLLDKSGRVTSVEYMSEGTVNRSDLYPRMLLERAVKCRASSAIIAHNHPRGKAEASQMDIYTTDRLGRIFRSAGIRLLRHYIVTESEATYLVPQLSDEPSV